MHRRGFLRAGLGLTAAALARPPKVAARQAGAPATPGPSPYGPLGAPDAQGLRLPAGFTSRVVAIGGQVVPGSAYTWHASPDGGATFALADGGWVYASNSEVAFGGGAGALRFGPDGSVVDAYPILAGTAANCAGGPTPWGTWLSCEEFFAGRVWECDPTGRRDPVARPALGTFVHESVAVDPTTGRLYLTEDRRDGRLYRFTPEVWPDLDAGRLDVAHMGESGRVVWQPAAAGGATAFNGGEGIWYGRGTVWFATKGDNRVWALDTASDTLSVLYDAAGGGALKGVDNLVAAPAGDLLVAEDGGNMELVLITTEGRVAPFLRLEGHDGSEITGPAFDPSATRLYFSSQRGGDRGITYEVSGAFRRGPMATPAAVGGAILRLAQVAANATRPAGWPPAP